MTNFFKARWNKDNFWNLMFLVVTSLSVQVADFLLGFSYTIGLILLIFSLFVLPYLATRFNKVSLKDSELLNSNGKSIKTPSASVMWFIVWLGIPFTVFCSFQIQRNIPLLDGNLGIYNAIFWFLPVMYFILKNCPISFLFNKKAWHSQYISSHKSNWTGYDYYRNNTPIPKSTKPTQSESFCSSRNLVTNPAHRWYSGNIHHSNSIVTNLSNRWHSSNIYHRR